MKKAPTALPAALAREGLEERWKVVPGNFVNAQQLAALRARDGDLAESLMRSHVARAAEHLFANLPQFTHHTGSDPIISHTL